MCATYITPVNEKKKAMNLEESKKGCMGVFGVTKRRGK